MKVKITKKHIKKGKRKNPRKCPIALALHETGEFGSLILIGNCEITASYPGYDDPYYSFTLPYECHLFTCDYDEGKPVKPFEFEL